MMQPGDDTGTREDLALYRIETAAENLKAAEILYEAKIYRDANNRAYYAIFHCANAVLALDGKSYKRHKDVIANFNKDYVNTGIFPKNLGKCIGRAEKIRHASDYDDFYIARLDDVRDLINTAQEFLGLTREYYSSKLN